MDVISDVIIPLVSALVGAIAGGYVVHKFAVTRDAQSAKRSQRISYLISAYQRLINTANRSEGLSSAQKTDLESALSDVMLLGETEEVQAAGLFMENMASGNGSDLDALIRALRNSLRSELGLSELDLPNPYNLRMRG